MNNVAALPASSAKDAREISQELSKLGIQLDQLEHGLECLSERLRPVSRLPADSKSTGPGAPAVLPATPVGIRIYEQSQRVTLLTNHIGSMLDTLELD